MSSFELAQFNIARLKAPLDSPELADFVDNLDRINALAEAAPGYVWRLQTEAGDATALNPLGDDYLVNLTVWENPESLHDYVYRSGHVEIMKRRREWFERMVEAHMVLWWVPEGYRPTLEDAAARLATLREEGPSATAFTFREPYPAPGLNERADASKQA